MIRKVLTRAAIVLTVGWSVCAGWFTYIVAPDANTFRVAWNEPWTPPASDEVVGGMTDEELLQLLNPGAPPLPPGFVLDKPTSLERLQAARQMQAVARRSGARSKVATFALLAGAFWLLPIAAVWSIVWIFFPLLGRKPAD